MVLCSVIKACSRAVENLDENICRPVMMKTKSEFNFPNNVSNSILIKTLIHPGHFHTEMQDVLLCNFRFQKRRKLCLMDLGKLFDPRINFQNFLLPSSTSTLRPRDKKIYRYYYAGQKVVPF